MNTLHDQIKQVIDTEPVVVFIKGTPEAPACGNSMRALQALWSAGAPITSVDVLPDPRIRQELSALSEWPTIPQVFVKGELIGGADITEELNATGELKAKIDEALGAEHPQTVRTVELEVGEPVTFESFDVLSCRDQLAGRLSRPNDIEGERAMSELSWHGVGSAEEAPVGFLRRVDVEGAAVCLGRTADGWVAFQDTCTHEECSLADGELEEGVIVCPCHASEFDLRTGDVLSPPALEPLPIFEARVQGGELQVRLAPPPTAAEAVRAREDHVSAEVAHAATTAGPSLAGLTLDDVDLTDLDAWEEGVPYAWLTLLRREAPLFWQPEVDGRGFWVFTRYDDIVQVSKEWETYSSELGGTSLEDLTPEEVEARKSMLDTDPPAHTRLRALVNKGFTPRVVNTYEGRIRGLARGILSQAFEQNAFDWVEDVASEIPMWVFSEIMGLPVDDRRLLIELGDKLLGNTDPEVVGEENVRDLAATDPTIRLQPFSSPFAADLIEYGCRLGAARRTDPRDDVTTRLVEAEIDGSRLSEHEFGLFFILLTTAGNETTRHTISLGLLDLLAHPEERARLIADPSLAGTAADEILRRAHPVHHFRRTAASDVTMHGRRIEAGDKVTLWYASGNYDEEKFADPFRFDIGRQPNRHLTFGLGGPHFCLGAHLAKLEVRIWLEEMVPYLERIELAEPPVRLRSNFFNGIKRLPVQVRS